MFRKYIIIVFVFFFSQTDLIAQKPKLNQKYLEKFKDYNQTSILKLSLLSPFIKTLSLSYESTISKDNSLNFGLYLFSGSINKIISSSKAFGLTFGYRHYFSHTAPVGIYCEPSIRFQNVSGNIVVSKRTNDPLEVNSLTAGFMLGKQWLIGEKISLNYYVGPIFSIADSDIASTNILANSLNGYWFRSGFTMGYKF